MLGGNWGECWHSYVLRLSSCTWGQEYDCREAAYFPLVWFRTGVVRWAGKCNLWIQVLWQHCIAELRNVHWVNMNEAVISIIEVCPVFHDTFEWLLSFPLCHHRERVHFQSYLATWTKYLKFYEANSSPRYLITVLHILYSELCLLTVEWN